MIFPTQTQFYMKLFMNFHNTLVSDYVPADYLFPKIIFKSILIFLQNFLNKAGLELDSVPSGPHVGRQTASFGNLWDIKVQQIPKMLLFL